MTDEELKIIQNLAEQNYKISEVLKGHEQRLKDLERDVENLKG